MNDQAKSFPIRKNHSGKWLVVGLFVLGGAVMAMFFASPYKFDPAPKEAVWGKPTARISPSRIEMAAANGDPGNLVFARNFPGNSYETFANRHGWSQKPRAAVYYPAQNLNTDMLLGNAIFSEFSLYEARSIPNKGGSFGVWAVAVVDGKKFMVASVTYSTDVAKESAMLKKAWVELGSPPMILGGASAEFEYWNW